MSDALRNFLQERDPYGHGLEFVVDQYELEALHLQKRVIVGIAAMVTALSPNGIEPEHSSAAFWFLLVIVFILYFVVGLPYE